MLDATGLVPGIVRSVDVLIDADRVRRVAGVDDEQPGRARDEERAVGEVAREVGEEPLVAGRFDAPPVGQHDRRARRVRLLERGPARERRRALALLRHRVRGSVEAAARRRVVRERAPVGERGADPGRRRPRCRGVAVEDARRVRLEVVHPVRRRLAAAPGSTRTTSCRTPRPEARREAGAPEPESDEASPTVYLYGRATGRAGWPAGRRSATRRAG